MQQYGKRLKTSKKTKRVSQKKKKSKNSCRTMSVVFLLGKSGFTMGTLFSASVSKNFTGVFLWDIGGNNGFSLKNSGGQLQFSAEFLQ